MRIKWFTVSSDVDSLTNAAPVIIRHTMVTIFNVLSQVKQFGWCVIFRAKAGLLFN